MSREYKRFIKFGRFMLTQRVNGVKIKIDNRISNAGVTTGDIHKLVYGLGRPPGNP